MLTHSPSLDTCPVVILHRLPKNICLISQKAHHTFLIQFHIFSYLFFIFFWPLKLLPGPLLQPFLWENCSLTCFPSTYSRNCVHNKDLFHHELKHKATKKALTSLLTWPLAYRASTSCICITAIWCLFCSLVCRVDLYSLAHLHTTAPQTALPVWIRDQTINSEELKPSHHTHL